jgi:hypothetical protein
LPQGEPPARIFREIGLFSFQKREKSREFPEKNEKKYLQTQKSVL